MTRTAINLSRRSGTLIAISLALLALLAFTLGSPYLRSNGNSLQIAVAGPVSGKQAGKGQTMVDAATLAIEQYNAQRDPQAPQLTLKVFDDKNDVDTAEDIARKITYEDRSIAVIGHRSSKTSARAAPIYQRSQIPVISGTATADTLSVDNPWFFRTIATNGYQAHFIALYIKQVLAREQVSIVYGDDPYGQTFANGFTNAASTLQMTMDYQWKVSLDRHSRASQLQAIAEQLRRKPTGAIFIALRDEAAAELVMTLRRANITTPMIGGTSVGKQGFPNAFRHEAEEQRTPGYFTEGLYATSGLIFDAADNQTNRFRQQFRQRFGYTPDAAAASYYDAVRLITQAIEQAPHSNTAGTRKQLQQWLSAINHAGSAIDGIGSPFYFNPDGDAVRPLTVGRYHHNQLISAPIQLRLDNNRQPDQASALRLGNQQLQLSHIAYTGLVIDKISELDMDTLSHTIDFTLWFKASPEINPADIVFTNAIDEVNLGTPVEERQTGQAIYRLYKASGKFSGDFLHALRNYGEHQLGLQFRHRTLNQHQLSYVSDSTSPAAQGNHSPLLESENHWMIASTTRFQDTLTLNGGIESQPYSRFNVVASLKENRLQLRQLVPTDLAFELLLITLVASLLIRAIRHTPSSTRLAFVLWLAEVISAYLTLICGEAFAVHRLTPQLNNFQLDWLIKGFNSCWWIYAAIAIISGIQRLIWIPLEQSTGQKPPRIIRAMLNSLTIALAISGIIAFVFGHELTSLLATSGLLAMIIGLAIQMNISNFFSGIAINLERPFRIGDHIEINGQGTGQVVDITWRSTKLRNKLGDVFSIPNAVAADNTIVNFTLEPGDCVNRLAIYVSPSHPPQVVTQLISDALVQISRQHERLIEQATGDVAYQGVDSRGAHYMVYITSPDFMVDDPAIPAALGAIWTMLNAAGIEEQTGFSKLEQLLEPAAQQA